ncbi:MAG: hypothetical protein K6A44_06790 [bacterium]|nr:hypothetical protein [bacterium]
MTNEEKRKQLLQQELRCNEMLLKVMLEERLMKSKDFEEEIEHLTSKPESLMLQREEVIKQIPSYNEEIYREYKKIFILDNEIKEREKTLNRLKEFYAKCLADSENKIKMQKEKIEELHNKIYGSEVKQ